MGFLFLFLLGTAVALHLWKAGKASYYRIMSKANSKCKHLFDFSIRV